MNTYAKIAVAAAAVLIVALVGYNLLPASRPGIGGPAADRPTDGETASTHSEPKPSPSPSAASCT